jgi:Protein of unknown function (DUF2281)
MLLRRVEDFPMSTAELVYEKLKDAPPSRAQEVLNFLEFLEAKQAAAAPVEASGERTFAEFFGVLKDSKIFDGDPVEIQRKMRAEWDREWDR